MKALIRQKWLTFTQKDLFCKLSTVLALLLFISIGTSCAPLQVIDYSLQQQSLSTNSQVLEEIEKITEVIVENKKPSIAYKPFPMDYNEHVEKWLTYLSTGKGKNHMRRYLERSSRYINYMGDLFAEQNMPRELVYMSMNESGFWPSAKSKANAVGYWQFIKPTASSYQLTMNRYIDERQDFHLSTEAAINFLQDLYSQFGDWRLSMAGYNCGPKCVRNAIKKTNSKNYWYLVSKRALPKETRDYVPKIIAMAIISQAPESFGFYSLNYQTPLYYKNIILEGDSSLSNISDHFDIPHSEMKSLNPKFKTDRVPANSGYVRIPGSVRI